MILVAVSIKNGEGYASKRSNFTQQPCVTILAERLKT